MPEIHLLRERAVYEERDATPTGAHPPTSAEMQDDRERQGGDEQQQRKGRVERGADQ